MSAFFDTNVLVYCTDTADRAKQLQARALVTQFGESGQGFLGTQVLIELFHVLTRKQSMPAASARDLTRAYAVWPVINSDALLVAAALDRSVNSKLSIFDAMVIEAALRAGADTLYSEDMQHGQRFDSLTVINPFVS